MIEVEELQALSAEDVRLLWRTRTFFVVIQKADGEIQDVILIGEHVSNVEFERVRTRARERGLVFVLSPPIACRNDRDLHRSLDETIQELDRDEAFDRTHPRQTD